MMGRKASPSPEKIILDYWKETVPPDLVRVFGRLLPSSVEPPKQDADDRQLLAFYRRITPDSVNELIDTAARLSFPITDARGLAEQADSEDKRNRMLSAVVSVDFPIVSLRHFLDVAVMREMSTMFASCYREYHNCLAKGESSAAKAKCEREYQACADYVSIQIFIALNRELFIRTWKGFPWPPRGPWPPQPWLY